MSQPLPEIDPTAWEHPADAAALSALRSLPGFDLAVRKVYGQINRVAVFSAMRRKATVPTAESHPELVAAYARVCEVFDIPEPWELLVLPEAAPNAAAVGAGPSVLVVTQGLLDLMDQDELAIVLAHEVGHLLSDHVLYKTMLRVLISVGWMAFGVPVPALLLVGVLAALQEWDRKSELSADRASLLLAGRAEPVIATLQKVQRAMEASGKAAPWDQARRTDEGEAGAAEKLREVLFKVAHALLSRHPVTEDRVAELRAWEASGAPARILGGHYPRRKGPPQTRAEPGPDGPWEPWEAWREPLEKLQQDAAAAADPAAAWLRDAQQTAASRYEDAVGWLRRKVEGE